MGLHRDGEHYGLAPLETHVRRLIWHQLCFLDIRTCEVQGPHPGIRREEYDTKMPLAVDDGSLVGAAVAPELPGRWTPMLLPVIRFEINEMMRNIWADRRRLEARRTTLPAVLTKIEEFRHRLFAKYEPILADDSEDDDDGDDDDDENCNDDDGDNDETRQAGLLRQYTRLVMHLLASRLHVMVLHAYYVNSPKALPPKAASVLIMSAVLIIEVAARLETDPRFARWAWYLGAYTQYHAALLLATEAYYRSVADADDPDAATTDRIWACLDHVFGLDPAAPRDVKGRILLGDIMTRTAAYHRLRRSRGPTAVQAAVPSMNAIGTAFSATSCRISSYSGDGQHQQQPHQKQQHQQQSKGSPAVVSIRLHSTPSDTGHSTADVASGHQSCYHYQQQPRQKMPPPPSMPLGGVQGQQSSMMQMPIPMPMEVSPGDPAGGAGGSSLPQELESVDWLSDMLRETSGRQEGSDAHRVSVPTAQEMFDALFPINPSTGQLDLPGYHDPNLGMRWQTWTGV